MTNSDVPRVVPRWKTRAWYAFSLPERTLRAGFAALFGGVHETAQLVLPRFARRSKLYEVTAKNALRIAIELVGGVKPASAGHDGEAAAGEPAIPSAGRVAVKKGAGNVVEFGSIAAFGFSPLWLLAGASDLMNGTRVYLRTLENELAAAGLLPPETRFTSFDDLLGSLEGASGTTAGFIDMPPLELAELRRSLAELRDDVNSLPSPGDLAALFNGLVRASKIEGRPLLQVSSGVGLAFLVSARNVTRDELVTPYREDWAPLRQEGFGAYAVRVAGPYKAAITGHFSPANPTWTERAADWLAACATDAERLTRRWLKR